MSMNIYVKYKPNLMAEPVQILTGPNFHNSGYRQTMQISNEWLMNWSDEINDEDVKRDMIQLALVFDNLKRSPYEVIEVSVVDLLRAIHKVFALISYEKTFVGNENLARPDEEIFMTMNRLNSIATFLLDVPRDAKVYGL